jgi:hypothetical protein
LEERGLVNVSDIRGEWETFRTTVVRDYQPGKNALVIAGSDKRAVVYGLYTLAEQCGQSPLVLHTYSHPTGQQDLQHETGTIGGLTSRLLSTTPSTRSQ